MLPLSTPRQSNTLLVYGQSSKPVKWRNASRNAMDLQWQYARIFRTGVQARGWEPGWVFKVLGLKKSFSKFVAFGRFGASRKAQKAFWVEKKGFPCSLCIQSCAQERIRQTRYLQVSEQWRASS